MATSHLDGNLVHVQDDNDFGAAQDDETQRVSSHHIQTCLQHSGRDKDPLVLLFMYPESVMKTKMRH